MKSLARLFAAAVILLPTSAWAHGDHGGAHGIVHVLTNPVHVGALLLAGATLWLAARQLPKGLRRIAEARARRLVARNRAA